MATTLSVSTGYANGWTFARHYRKSNLVAGFIQFDALNTSSDFVGFPRIVVILIVKEVDVFQMMCPDTE